MEFTLCQVVTLLWITVTATSATFTCPAGKRKPCHCNKDFTEISCDNAGLIAIPENIPNVVESLSLAGNSISTIPKEAFKNLQALKHLDIRQSAVHEINVDAFTGLNNLQDLFLTSNTIEYFNGSICLSLPKLTGLYLGENSLDSIPNLGMCSALRMLVLERNNLQSLTFPDGFLKLKNLKSMVMGNNNFPTISRNDLQALKNSMITRLSISRCKTYGVEEGSFSYVQQSLVSLVMSYNPLNAKSIKNICDALGGKQMASLNFNGVEFGGLLPADTFEGLVNTSLRTLNLRWNTITEIKDRTFVYLPKLTRLDVSFSKVQQVDPEALKGLNALTDLLLNKNEISSVPHSLPSTLINIDLSYNVIAKIPDQSFSSLPKLTTLKLSGNTIQKLGQYSFAGLEKLQELDLSNNHIDGAGVLTFSPLRRLQKLFLQANKLTKIVNNPRMFEKQQFLQFLDLSDNMCSVLPMGIFRNLFRLTTLKLTGNSLGQLLQSDVDGNLFEGLKNLKQLYLEQNNIRELPVGLFKGLMANEKIYLRSNDIVRWGEGTFSSMNQTLTFFDISYNSISTIGQTSMNGLHNIREMNLTGNPFACDCNLVWFRRWMDRTNVTFLSREKYICNSPTKMEGMPLNNFNPDTLVCVDYFFYELGGSLGGCLIIFLVLIVVLYRYRWYIKLRVHRVKETFKARIRQREYEPVPGNDLRYDAYISNIQEDRQFIMEVLLPNFDRGNGFNGQFSLCYEERDFAVGEYILTNIGDSISQSQRGIIILSNSYLSDGLKELELHLLVQEALTRPFALIVIALGVIPPGKVPGSLRHVFESNDHLTWSDDDQAEQALFMERLTNKLQRRPITIGAAAADLSV